MEPRLSLQERRQGQVEASVQRRLAQQQQLRRFLRRRRDRLLTEAAAIGIGEVDMVEADRSSRASGAVPAPVFVPAQAPVPGLDPVGQLREFFPDTPAARPSVAATAPAGPGMQSDTAAAQREETAGRGVDKGPTQVEQAAFLFEPMAPEGAGSVFPRLRRSPRVLAAGPASDSVAAAAIPAIHSGLAAATAALDTGLGAAAAASAALRSPAAAAAVPVAFSGLPAAPAVPSAFGGLATAVTTPVGSRGQKAAAAPGALRGPLTDTPGVAAPVLGTAAAAASPAVPIVRVGPEDAAYPQTQEGQTTLFGRRVPLSDTERLQTDLQQEKMISGRLRRQRDEYREENGQLQETNGRLQQELEAAGNQLAASRDEKRRVSDQLAIAHGDLVQQFQFNALLGTQLLGAGQVVEELAGACLPAGPAAALTAAVPAVGGYAMDQPRELLSPATFFGTSFIVRSVGDASWAVTQFLKLVIRSPAVQEAIRDAAPAAAAALAAFQAEAGTGGV